MNENQEPKKIKCLFEDGNENNPSEESFQKALDHFNK